VQELLQVSAADLLGPGQRVEIVTPPRRVSFPAGIPAHPIAACSEAGYLLEESLFQGVLLFVRDSGPSYTILRVVGSRLLVDNSLLYSNPGVTVPANAQIPNILADTMGANLQQDQWIRSATLINYAVPAGMSAFLAIQEATASAALLNPAQPAAASAVAAGAAIVTSAVAGTLFAVGVAGVAVAAYMLHTGHSGSVESTACRGAFCREEAMTAAEQAAMMGVGAAGAVGGQIMRGGVPHSSLRKRS
jgi:hypothetical protein